MADENLTNDAEELASQAEEQLDEVVEQVEETVAETVETKAEEVAPLLDELDAATEKAEAAVQHVAEEAAADAAEAQAAVAEEAPAPKKRERRSKQARAEKAAKSVAEDVAPKAAPKASGLGMPATIGLCVASLAVGLLLGRFVLGGGASGGSEIAGKTTVTEAELDKTYASYTYEGKTNTITVREVIEQNGSVDAAMTEDGSYTLPSAEYAVNAARTAILNSEMESRGIEVSEKEAAAYAETALGTSDYDAIASTYGMDAEAVKKLVMDNCRLNALREEVVGGDLPAMPDAPAEPEEGAEDKATKEYADYIIGLAGEDWDAEKGAWANEESPYATALEGYGFSADEATYEAAQAAYYVAYQQYSEKQTEMTSDWTEFLNGLLSNASIEVGSLIS